MAYRPSQPPPELSLESLAEYLYRELDALARDQGETTVVELRPIHAEPAKRQEGMIVYADGTDWNPGSGKGVYVYTGAAWSKL